MKKGQKTSPITAPQAVNLQLAIQDLLQRYVTRVDLNAKVCAQS